MATNLGPTSPPSTFLVGASVKALATVAVDANGIPMGGSPSWAFLGTSGALTSPMEAEATLAGNDTAHYAQVPTGKRWLVYGFGVFVYDATASAGTAMGHFGAQAAPSAGSGLRLRTVLSDAATTKSTIIGSVETNSVLLFALGKPATDGRYVSGDNVIQGESMFASPLVLEAGERFEAKHLQSVAYSAGVVRICYVELDA